jgi:hypothetical protein
MPSSFEIYDRLEEATQDVLREINASVRAQRVPPRMGSINLELNSALMQQTLLTISPHSQDEMDALALLRDKVQRVVQHVPLDAFKRDKTLKAIRDAYKETHDQLGLVEALDEFFIENELYRDVPETKTALEQIHAEDLQLVAYEVFG